MTSEATETPVANQLSVIAEKKWRQALFTTFTLNELPAVGRRLTLFLRPRESAPA